MTVWRENNFLEKLMAEDREPSPIRVTGGCPDTDSLCGYAEGRTRGVVREAIAQHLEECPDCADLHERLASFARPPLDGTKEWGSVAKRFDDWIEEVLETQDTGARSQRERAPVVAMPGADWRKGAGSLRKWHWALAAAAAVLVLGATAGVARHYLAPREWTQSAVLTNPPSPAVAPATPPAPPAASPQNPEPTAPPPPASEAPATAAAQQRKIQEPAEEPSAPTAPVAVVGPPTETATAQSNAETSLPTQSAQVEPPRQPSPAGGTGASRGDSRPAADSSETVEYRPRATGDSPSSSRSANSTSPTAATLPPSFRLSAGTRLIIQLTSREQFSNGLLVFRGRLSEEVKITDAVPLGKGTLVEIFETSSQGKISLVLAAFTVGSVRYAIRRPGGDATAPAGIPMDVAPEHPRLLETFVDGDSVYLKPVNPPARPASHPAVGTAER